MLHIHYNDFVMILFLILLSMQMILLSTLSVIRYRIYKTLWNEAGSGLLVLMLETLNPFCFNDLLILMPIM